MCLLWHIQHFCKRSIIRMILEVGGGEDFPYYFRRNNIFGVSVGIPI
jgi:hypothetical protein